MVLIDTFLTRLNDILVKIASAIFILFLGFIIGRFLGKLSHKILKELEIDEMIANAIRVKIPLADLVSFIVHFFIYSVAIVLSLNQFGIGIKFLYFIVVIILLSLLIFIITTIKDLIPNLYAATKIKNKFAQGQKLKVGNIEGTIIEITNTDVRIVTKHDDFMSIPNSYLIKKLKI